MAPSAPLSHSLATLLAVLALAGCQLPPSPHAPTPEAPLTSVYQTVDSGLTLTAAPVTLPISTTASPASPTTSPTGETISLAATTAPPTREATASPGTLCDRVAAGSPKIDVTIDDDTILTAGQSFTKIWRLQNSGTCSWTRDYAIVWFSGERMGAPASMPLGTEVPPGQTIEIAVDMLAPESPGTYQSNWKLRNASNILFGLGPSGSSPFWVRIIVVPAPTQSATPATSTLTPTPATPTGTSAPTTQVGSQVTLHTGDSLDLDSLQRNPAEGADLVYLGNPDGTHPLVPVGGALLGIFLSGEPSLASCQAIPLGDTPIGVEALPSGSWLCYRTSQGAYGRACLLGLDIDDYSLTLDLLTWLSSTPQASALFNH